jgi:hypothetical protein
VAASTEARQMPGERRPTMTTQTTTRQISISINRADDGSGGWSLHDARPGHEGDDFLVSGSGRLVGGQWALPPKRAYATARRVARERDRGQGTRGVDLG